MARSGVWRGGRACGRIPGLPAGPATRYHSYFLPSMTHTATARILKAVNVLIVVLLAAVLAATYWYAWRPLPQRSGSVVAAVAAPVSVSFDSLGEPHIRAASRSGERGGVG